MATNVENATLAGTLRDNLSRRTLRWSLCSGRRHFIWLTRSDTDGIESAYVARSDRIGGAHELGLSAGARCRFSALGRCRAVLQRRQAVTHAF
jgi:hypothetical protein